MSKSTSKFNGAGMASIFVAEWYTEISLTEFICNQIQMMSCWTPTA